SLAPCLISWLGAKLTGWVTLPGTPKTSRPNSMASRAVISEPLYWAPSTTTTPSGIPATMRLRIGKFSGAGCVPRGNSLMIAPRTYNADTREIQHVRVAANVQHHRRIVNLQQALRVFRIGPVH